MDFFALAAERESCREYSSQPVELEKLTRCVEAAQMAPSACNSQPWHFTIVTGDKAKKLAKLVQGGGFNRFADQCSAFIVVNEEPAKLNPKLSGLVEQQKYASIDIGLATAHLCFAATSQGLSTCILGWFQESDIQELLDIPASKRIRLVITVGYAAPPHTPRKKIRKPLEELVTYAE